MLHFPQKNRRRTDMRTLSLVIALVVIVGVSEVRAERASVIAAKAVSKATVAAVKAVPKAPGATWRCVKWVVKHA